jgi:hypothetical protein
MKLYNKSDLVMFYVFPCLETGDLERMTMSRFICLTSPMHKGLEWELSLLWDEVRAHSVRSSLLRKSGFLYSTFGCIRMILVDRHKR